MIAVSLGAGVQSSALLVLSVLGLRDCPRAEVAVFADTQDEPPWVYTQLTALTAWAGARGVPVEVVTVGRLADETLGPPHKRRAALPVFTLGQDGRAAMLPRQCTEDYKLVPIRRFYRQRLGYAARAKLPARAVTQLIGISFDERDRIKDSARRWLVNRYPLIDAVMRRTDCLALLEAQGLPAPQKSACIYCPFHDDTYWLRLKTEYPQVFAQACAFDEAVRDSSSRGLVHPVFLHRSLQPLAAVTFASHPQLDGFAAECGGGCGL